MSGPDGAGVRPPCERWAVPTLRLRLCSCALSTRCRGDATRPGRRGGRASQSPRGRRRGLLGPQRCPSAEFPRSHPPARLWFALPLFWDHSLKSVNRAPAYALGVSFQSFCGTLPPGCLGRAVSRGQLAGLSCHLPLRGPAMCPPHPRADVRPGPQGDSGVRKPRFLTRNTRSVRSHRASQTWGPHAATGRGGNVTERGRDRRAAPASQRGGHVPDPAGGLTAASRRPAGVTLPRGSTCPGAISTVLVIIPIM